MVHDSTPLDNLHHELINHLAIAGNYARIAADYIQKGENLVEVSIMLKKVTEHNDKSINIIREDYIERKRKGE